MNVWSITVVGIGMVFFILIVLSEMVRIIGSVLGPKPLPAGMAPESDQQRQQDSSETTLKDAAMIAAVFESMGQRGNIKVKRVDD